MKHELLKIFIFGFFLGVLISYGFHEAFDNKVPEAFEIERDGKHMGYADMDQSMMEFVKLEGKNINSPGMFVAFPIFKEKE